MRSCGLILILAAGLGIGLAQAGADTDKKVDAERVAKLIQQLGSDKFEDRETAAKTLEEIGPAALEALKKASENSDVEVQRRAKDLVRKIEKRVETEKFLSPTRLQLTLKDTPVVEAVAELAQKGGGEIVLTGDLNPLKDRRITLDTGDTTFWQAFDQLCQKAGLDETAPPKEKPAALALQNGKPRSLPTYYAGALRIRALPADLVKPAVDETAVVLEYCFEPKLHCHNLEHLRIEKAIDGKDQALQHVPAAPQPPNPEHRPLVIQGMIVQGRTYPRLSRQTLVARFKKGNQPSQEFKELSGSISTQLLVGPQPLVTVDNILKAVGQTVKGEHGGAITVQDAKREENGACHLRIQLEGHDPEAPLGVTGVHGRPRIFFNPADLVLLDAKGNKFDQALPAIQPIIAGRNVSGLDITVTFKPREGQAGPAKLVYLGKRNVAAEVPFSLKNVPLP